MPLTQDPLQGCGQAVSWGAVISSLAWGWRILLQILAGFGSPQLQAVGQIPQFLTMWALPLALCVAS